MISQSESREDKSNKECAQSLLGRETTKRSTCESRDDDEQSENEENAPLVKLPDRLCIKPHSLGMDLNGDIDAFSTDSGRSRVRRLSISSNADYSLLRSESDEVAGNQKEEKPSFGIFGTCCCDADESSSPCLEEQEGLWLSERDYFSHSNYSRPSTVKSEQNVATSASEDSGVPDSFRKGETESDLLLDVDEHGDSNARSSENNHDKQTIVEAARKTGIAVAGGMMVGIGMVMIPLPTPFGLAVAGAGMAVLGTEFPAAQHALDSARDALVGTLEKYCGEVSNSDNVECHAANENMGDSVTRTLKGVGQRALPLIKAMGTQVDKSE